MTVTLVVFSCVALRFWGRGSVFGGLLMTPPLVCFGFIFGRACETTEQVGLIYFSEVWIGIGVALLVAWAPYMFYERQIRLTGLLLSRGRNAILIAQ